MSATWMLFFLQMPIIEKFVLSGFLRNKLICMTNIRSIGDHTMSKGKSPKYSHIIKSKFCI